MELTLLSRLDGAQQRRARENITAIFAHQAQLYTAGQSSSLPEETAAELLHSILWCLRQYMQDTGTDVHALLDADIFPLFDAALALAGRRCEDCRRLFMTVCTGAPIWLCRAMRDTLSGIRDYFLHYDCRFFAHHVPPSIDYRLCLPPAAELEGTAFTADYLTRLSFENRLLSAFPKEEADRLLRAVSPAYYGNLMGVFEPVAVSAVGSYLAQGRTGSLFIDEVQRSRLCALLSGPDGRTRFTEGARRLCTALGIRDGGCAGYVADAAAAQWPRVSAVLGQGAQNVFFTPA